MKNKMPYSTPEGYFDELEGRLRSIPTSSSAVPLRSRLAPYLAMAASFAIALVIGSTVLNKTATPSQQLASDEEIIEYLIDSDISLNQIEEYLTYNE